MILRMISAAFVLLCFAACAHAAPACHPTFSAPPTLAARLHPVCGINAPEDLDLMPDGRHIVVSETGGASRPTGALALLDTRTDAVAPLPRLRDGGPVWGDPACPDPGAAAPFAPHGIHVTTRPGGAVQLLVIDHAGERIEFYQVQAHGRGLAAAWRGCVAQTGSGMFNDLAAAPHGGFVATVMFDRTLVFQPSGALSPPGVQKLLSGADTGYLQAWAPGQTLHRLPGSEAAFNNGIQLSRDGKLIYFAAWTGKQLRTYDLATGKTIARLDVDFLPDNISVAPDGTFLVAGIRNAAVWAACTMQKAEFCAGPFKVVRWDPTRHTVTTVLDVPAGPMPGASVAVQSGNALYIGSFSGDRVLKVTGRPASP